MRLLEDQAKALLERNGITCPRGYPCSSADEVMRAYDLLGPLSVKALIAAGGRARAGGVQFASSRDEAAAAASRLLGKTVLGRSVDRVLAEERIDIDNELFLACRFELKSRTPVIIASSRGGVDIEEAAAEKRAELVIRRTDPRRNLYEFEARELARDIGLDGARLQAFGRLVPAVWDVFRSNDAWQVEINPLVFDSRGSLVAVSAVVELDDEATFRHHEWNEYLNYEGETERERAVRIANEANLNTGGVRFQEMDGDIVYLVVGGGSSLAYIDFLLARGLRPANYIDISPGRDRDQKLRAAYRAALSLPRKRAVLMTLPHANMSSVDGAVGIFVEAYRELEEQLVGIPVVIRVAGRGLERARELALSIGAHFFGDEVTIEEAITSLDRILNGSKGAPVA